MAKKQSLKARETAVVKQMAAYVKDAREARQGDADAADAQQAAEQKDRLRERWKIDPREIPTRVAAIRRELEEIKQRMDGAVFDAMTGGTAPRALEGPDPREPDELTKYLCPYVANQFEHFSERQIDGELYEDIIMGFSDATLAAYQIGMFAGAIFANCDGATIDRFERGLAFTTAGRYWQVK